jgi:hypothetical protein
MLGSWDYCMNTKRYGNSDLYKSDFTKLTKRFEHLQDKKITKLKKQAL